MQDIDVQNQITENGRLGDQKQNFSRFSTWTSKRSQFTYLSPVHFIDAK